MRIIGLALVILAWVIGTFGVVFAAALLFRLFSLFSGAPPLGSMDAPLFAGAVLGLSLAYGLLRMRIWLITRTYIEKQTERRDMPVLLGFIVGSGLGVVAAVALIITLGLHELLGVLAWAACAICGLVIGLLFSPSTNEDESRCPQCGYDLRGTPPTADGRLRCSECGTELKTYFDDGEDEELPPAAHP